MGMAIIPPDLSNRIAQFSFYEFCQAIGYEKGGESQRIFMAALDECVGCVITIDTPTEIRKFTWIQFAIFHKETGIVNIEFSKGLTDYLIELKKMYARIDLIDLGKLQSLYALRIFEMAKSYESLAGKNGNKGKSWFFERSIEELRKIFGIEAEKYKLTRDFRIFVIEKPCEEIRVGTSKNTVSR
jgi:plasmid replication initiation protein